MSATLNPQIVLFEVRFPSLFDESRALVFPCDARGAVDLDRLPPRARSNYLFARAMVGRDYATPRVASITATAALDASAAAPRAEALA